MKCSLSKNETETEHPIWLYQSKTIYLFIIRTYLQLAPSTLHIVFLF